MLICFLLLVYSTLSLPADNHEAGSGNRSSEKEHRPTREEEKREAKRKKTQLQKEMNQYSANWEEANQNIKIGHTGREPWMKLRQKQKQQDEHARKFNLVGNILHEHIHVQQAMHEKAELHSKKSQKIQKKMNDVKENGRTCPTQEIKQNNDHYDKMVKYSSDIMKQNRILSGINNCRIM